MTPTIPTIKNRYKYSHRIGTSGPYAWTWFRGHPWYPKPIDPYDAIGFIFKNPWVSHQNRKVFRHRWNYWNYLTSPKEKNDANQTSE